MDVKKYIFLRAKRRVKNLIVRAGTRAVGKFGTTTARLERLKPAHSLFIHRHYYQTKTRVPSSGWTSLAAAIIVSLFVVTTIRQKTRAPSSGWTSLAAAIITIMGCAVAITQSFATNAQERPLAFVVFLVPRCLALGRLKLNFGRDIGSDSGKEIHAILSHQQEKV
jgi:hypothetical protein